MTNLDASKPKKCADNFKFDENGTTFFKQVENTVEKGEITFYRHIDFCLYLFTKK